jgi:hypothetical protein
MQAAITPHEARELLKLFGGYMHSILCDYVQEPNGECNCTRAPLYLKVREIANQRTEASQS